MAHHHSGGIPFKSDFTKACRGKPKAEGIELARASLESS